MPEPINPIIPGFHPDPTICRRGSDYYIVNSSFEYLPGLPVHHSRDLVNWSLIGHAIPADTAIDMRSLACGQGMWAPTLRYHAGVWYIVCTLVGGGGNFLVTADYPAGPWSDPVWIDAKGFDCSIFFDEDGTAYYTRREGADILQARIDPSTGHLDAPPRRIAGGLCSPDAEAPHLYRFGDTYYLMTAEGGTRFGHSLTLRRADNPWGPWETCPANSVLTHRHLSGSFVRDTGHGDLVRHTDGSWWLVVLATRHPDYDSHGHLGRETFLCPVDWPNGGWPTVGDGGTVPDSFSLPEGSEPRDRNVDFRWDFAQSRLPLDCSYIRNPVPDASSLTAQPGWLRLRALPVYPEAARPLAFVGRRQQHLSGEARTRLDPSGLQPGDHAGLLVIIRDTFYYACLVKGRGDDRRIVFRQHLDRLLQEETLPLPGAGPVQLSVAFEPRDYRFSVQTDDVPAVVVGTAATRLICPEVAEAWTGVLIGLLAVTGGNDPGGWAAFDHLAYRGVNPGPPLRPAWIDSADV